MDISFCGQDGVDVVNSCVKDNGSGPILESDFVNSRTELGIVTRLFEMFVS